MPYKFFFYPEIAILFYLCEKWPQNVAQFKEQEVAPLI